MISQHCSSVLVFWSQAQWTWFHLKYKNIRLHFPFLFNCYVLKCSDPEQTEFQLLWLKLSSGLFCYNLQQAFNNLSSTKRISTTQGANCLLDLTAQIHIDARITWPINEAKHLLSSPQLPCPCFLSWPIFWLQSYRWHEGSTAGLPSGILLNIRHSQACKCQPHKFSCYAVDSGVSDHGNYGQEALPVCSMSWEDRLPLENYS